MGIEGPATFTTGYAAKEICLVVIHHYESDLIWISLQLVISLITMKFNCGFSIKLPQDLLKEYKQATRAALEK